MRSMQLATRQQVPGVATNGFSPSSMPSKRRSSSRKSHSGRKANAAVVKVSKTSVQVRFPKEQSEFGTWFEAEFPSLWEKFLAATKS